MLRSVILALFLGSLCGCSNTAPPTATPAEATPSGAAPSTNPPASVSGFAGTSWPATAQSHADRIGERLTYQCPPDGVSWFIYGTDVYTSDSSVCTAAVHMGLITFAQGGVVTIEMRPGQDSYVGSNRNDVHSAQYGHWEASYVFVDSAGVVIVLASAAPTPRVTATAPATSPSSVPGQTSAVDADLLEPGKLTICMPFDRIRFAERDAAGEPFGVDVEIGLAIASHLGLEPAIAEVAFEDLIDEIRNSQCDVTIGGQFITAARLELIDMIPYRQGTQHVVVAAGNPLGIHELADLCGRKVAIVQGTIHVDILRDVSDDCVAAGQEEVEAAEYPTESGAEEALSSGEANAYIGNDFITVEQPDKFELSAALPPLRNGIGHRLGAGELDAAVRAALRTIIGDGTYDAILEKYDVTQVRLTELP